MTIIDKVIAITSVIMKSVYHNDNNSGNNWNNCNSYKMMSLVETKIVDIRQQWRRETVIVMIKSGNSAYIWEGYTCGRNDI